MSRRCKLAGGAEPEGLAVGLVIATVADGVAETIADGVAAGATTVADGGGTMMGGAAETSGASGAMSDVIARAGVGARRGSRSINQAAAPVATTMSAIRA